MATTVPGNPRGDSPWLQFPVISEPHSISTKELVPLQPSRPLVPGGIFVPIPTELSADSRAMHVEHSLLCIICQKYVSCLQDHTTPESFLHHFHNSLELLEISY
jgi:hypothetical protein